MDMVNPRSPKMIDLPFNIWGRMERAVENVRERLTRAVSALTKAGVPHAIVGGSAVGAWVATVDVTAVRNTQDVDILLARSDFDVARRAMEAAGFVYRPTFGVDMFLEAPGTKARDAVHVIFAGEKVKAEYEFAAPSVDAAVRSGTQVPVIALEDLVRMKLTSYRGNDQVHVQDLIRVGLVDESWLEKVPPRLGSRLRELLSDPEG